jgi:fermentation-respiration switch protein FrsA (DUF1100 family)
VSFVRRFIKANLPDVFRESVVLLGQRSMLEKPMAPMLVIAGVKDTQVPISDVYLLLSSADTPKTAWINPQGGHLGRQVRVWPDPLIFKEVIIPWLVRTLREQAPDSH